MKQVRQGSLKFDGFRPFASFAFEQKLSLSAPETPAKFASQLAAEIRKATDDDKFVFGHRTESMFAAMVTSLGSVKLIKGEDGTDCFAEDETLEVPDFRVVLQDGRQLLIEAKNFHQGDAPTKPFRMKANYVDSLTAYAKLMKCDLCIAVYWSRWNLWSLTTPAAFSRSGDWCTTDLGTAMKFNAMSLVGDVMVGTKMPLKMVFEVEHLSEARPEPTTREFEARITNVYASCAGRRIEDATESRIAFYMMLYGNLVEETIPVFHDDRLVAFEHVFNKEQETDQGFELVGSLSSMFSRFYRHATSDQDKGGVKQIHARTRPGALGQLIPKGFKGDALPLWILHQRPGEPGESIKE